MKKRVRDIIILIITIFEFFIYYNYNKLFTFTLVLGALIFILYIIFIYKKERMLIKKATEDGNFINYQIEKCEENINNVRNFETKMGLLITKSELLIINGDFDSALDLLNTIQINSRKIKKRTKVFYYNNLILIYLLKKEFNMAKTLYNQNINTILCKTKDKGLDNITKVNQGIYFFLVEDKDKGRDILIKSIGLDLPSFYKQLILYFLGVDSFANNRVIDGSKYFERSVKIAQGSFINEKIESSNFNL